MATFSSNQVRHFYVADAYSASLVTDSSAAGTLSVGGNATSGVYLVYKSPGGVVRSDIIDPNKLTYTKVTEASKMARKLRKDEVALDASVNGGDPIVGQDYLLRITFKQHFGLSTEDQYFKYGAVRVTPGMTAAQFYETMVDSLNKNFSREETELLKFSVNADDSGIIIEEVEQPWVLGKIESAPLFYSIQPDLVTVSGVEMVWGTVTAETPTTEVKNGKQIADLEYFAMGERGDLYRGIGFPNNFETKYLVDPSKEYSVIDLAFYYAGEGEDIQRSQKAITIAVPNGATGSEYTTVNAVLNALEASLGKTIAADLAVPVED